MTITEKAAYLKGLVEGKGLDPEAGEGKLWLVLSELVSDMAVELTALRKDHESLSDSVEEVEVGLEYLEELLQEDYDGDYEDYDSDEDDDDYYPFGNGSFRIVDDDKSDEDAEETDEDSDGVFYEVECPNCGEEISFDDETLDEGSIQCPNCGATLEFDMRGPAEDETAEESAPEGGKSED